MTQLTVDGQPGQLKANGPIDPAQLWIIVDSGQTANQDPLTDPIVNCGGN